MKKTIASIITITALMTACGGGEDNHIALNAPVHPEPQDYAPMPDPTPPTHVVVVNNEHPHDNRDKEKK